VALDVDASMDAAQDNRGGILRLRIRRRCRGARCGVNKRERNRKPRVQRCLRFVITTFRVRKIVNGQMKFKQRHVSAKQRTTRNHDAFDNQRGTSRELSRRNLIPKDTRTRVLVQACCHSLFLFIR